MHGAAVVNSAVQTVAFLGGEHNARGHAKRPTHINNSKFEVLLLTKHKIVEDNRYSITIRVGTRKITFEGIACRFYHQRKPQKPFIQPKPKSSIQARVIECIILMTMNFQRRSLMKVVHVCESDARESAVLPERTDDMQKQHNLPLKGASFVVHKLIFNISPGHLHR